MHDINFYSEIVLSKNLFVCFTKSFLRCNSCRKLIKNCEDLYTFEVNPDATREKINIAYCTECSKIDSSMNFQVLNFSELLKDLNLKLENLLLNHEQIKKTLIGLVSKKFDEIIKTVKHKLEKFLANNIQSATSQVGDIKRIKSLNILLTNFQSNSNMPIDYQIIEEILKLKINLSKSCNNLEIFTKKQLALENDLNNLNIDDASRPIFETLLESLRSLNELKVLIENPLENKSINLKSNHELNMISTNIAKSFINSHDKMDVCINNINLEDSIVENFKELKLLEKEAQVSQLSKFNLNAEKKPREEENMNINENFENLDAYFIDSPSKNDHLFSLTMTIDQKDNFNKNELDISDKSTSYFSRKIKEREKVEFNNVESFFKFREHKTNISKHSEIDLENKNLNKIHESLNIEKSNRFTKPFNEERSHIHFNSKNYQNIVNSSRSLGLLDNTILIFKIPKSIGSMNDCSYDLKKYFTAVKVINVVTDKKYPNKYYIAKLYLDCMMINEYFLNLPDVIEVNVNKNKLRIEKDLYSRSYPFLFVSKLYRR